MKASCAPLLLSLAAAATPAVPNAVNLTLFHVNEANYSGIANMDTGDAAGDAFFALRSVFLPIECDPANRNKHHFSGDCDNPEVVGADLTVTEVVVEVDSHFGNYSECNVCVNSTVPFTKDVPCNDGDYVCVCGEFRHLTTDCPPTVGMELPLNVFGRFPLTIFSPNYMFWLHGLVNRMNGTWYSTPSTGECTEGSDPKNCHWRLVESKRRVSKKCQMEYVFGQVTKRNTDCFNACDQPTNTTSTCYINCFYDTLLGDGSSHTKDPTGGMTREEITEMWSFPVRNDETKGGCPQV